jgi:hypothetical protein
MSETEALQQLNARWIADGKPHAAARNGHYYWTCPRCGEGGLAPAPLFVAMSDAIVHKRECPEIS